MDTTLPRSPMLSSKTPVIYEKYKSGCAWGLIHFLDFRRRKLANRPSKGGNGYTRNKPNFPSSEDLRKVTKSSYPARASNAATEGYRRFSDRNMVSNRGRKDDHHTKINLRVRMNEAVEAFINQRLISNQSTDFIDALEISNSNKELLMKLLQDPNSLLVKHVHELCDSQAKKQKTKTSSLSQPLNTIVVLKAVKQNCPNRISNWPSPKSHYNKKDGGVRPTLLSFQHIKRKLTHGLRAKRKEQWQMSHDRKKPESSRDVNITQDFGSCIGNKAASSTEICYTTSDLLKSLPEHDVLPMVTPGRDREHGFDSPQMRFSPFSTVNGYKRRVQIENMSGCSSSVTIEAIEAQPLYDGLHGGAKKSTIGHISPSTVSPAAEPPVESFCINIEELYESSHVESHLDMKNNAGISIDKQESLSKYIRSVLQISGLNWDELFRKWNLADQMLDSSMFDNVKLWHHKSCSTDHHRLIFSYINEVLSEMYRCYFRCSPWISLLDPRPRPARFSKDMVHEVLRHVDWVLLTELPQQTLQQLVENDLAKSGTWFNLRFVTEEVIIELADSILQDLVIDAAIQLQI
ncbi:uncharacterized protein LOC105792226 [Gossypium raimondii]|uniref:DUF4378 domain-containing protein n=1 Tax=Gossypium raimondii TaxID=29730 RepID=A0A0D2N1P0_GOSRA|nr:uncharacterized protein LOC105792226 [Gossypium raimondii]KJB25872.1 hypothetical protein B456_004G212500 [Gossypium raimondii]MBA0584456.1 hypothetical protein [Gossypium raimondii]